MAAGVVSALAGGLERRVAAGDFVIRISLQRASQGDRLAKPVFDTDGKMLLNAGVQLNEAYLGRLREHGVSEVCIRGAHSAAPAIEDGVSDASRIEALACAHACYLAALGGMAPPAGRVLDAVAGISDDLRRSPGKSVAVSPSRLERDWWQAHARNVALLSITTARALGLDRAQVGHIGAGALLHDIGLVGLSAQPLWAPEQESSAPGCGHPVLGFQLLIINPGISASSAVVCLQHHERLDGSGFPKHMTAAHVSIAAQICAAADTYDLLIAPPPFGDGVMAHVALAQLRQRSEIAGNEVRDAFARAVAPYPMGAVLGLDDGCRAVVTEAASGAKMKLRLIPDNGGSNPGLVELPQDQWAAIREVL